MTAFDVAIAGAGPAGAVLGALLARAGLSVAVADRTDRTEHRIGECLPAATAALLRRMRLPSPLDGGPHAPIDGVLSIWGGALEQQDFLNDPGAGGWRLDRMAFDRSMREAARGHGAEMVAEPVAGLARSGNGWRLHTPSGRVMEAAFLVDATGRRAALARRIGGVRRFCDEPMVAVWAIGAALDAAVCGHTLIEATEAGWWYGAVLPGRRPLAALHCAADAARRHGRDPRSWLAALGATRLVSTGLPAAAFAGVATRRSDARGMALSAYCGEAWLACGDAALSFDPLSSQGLHNAVATACMARDVLLAGDRAAALRGYSARLAAVRARYLAARRDAYSRLVPAPAA